MITMDRIIIQTDNKRYAYIFRYTSIFLQQLRVSVSRRTNNCEVENCISDNKTMSTEKEYTHAETSRNVSILFQY